MIPIAHKKMLHLTVKYLYKLDTDFASSLKTEINPFWLKESLKELSKSVEFEILSVGEIEFKDKFASAFIHDSAYLKRRLHLLTSFLVNPRRFIPNLDLLFKTKTLYQIYLCIKNIVNSTFYGHN